MVMDDPEGEETGGESEAEDATTTSEDGQTPLKEDMKSYDFKANEGRFSEEMSY